MLSEVTRQAARRFGDTPAFVADAGWAVSYAELDRASDELAAALVQRGIGAGDVLALVLPPIPEYVMAYLAAAKVAAITTGVNARLAPAERAAVLAAAQPALVLATEQLAPAAGAPWAVEIVTPASSAAGVLVGLRLPGEAPVPRQARDEDPVALVFTSGTTGTPKGALFCNRQLRAITAIDVGHEWGGGGAGLAATTLAHLAFMTKLPGQLRRGATQYLRLRWRAGDALRLTVEQRMRVVAGITTQVALMLRLADFDAHDVSAVEAVMIGGGPATPALVREARERFGAVVLSRYSCTEAGTGLGTQPTDPPEDAEETVGRPRAGVELALLDDHDRPVAPGSLGAVCLRSAAVMTGYWRDPEATAAAFTADGFVRTGDLGWLDDRGRLHLAGRSKEMYVRGGFNVFPAEVESVLAGHGSVAALAVVPRTDPVMGEIGVAVLVPRPGGPAPRLEELRTWGALQLASYKLPEDLLVVDDLPLTAMDKVDRRALSRLVAQMTPRAR